LENHSKSILAQKDIKPFSRNLLKSSTPCRTRVCSLLALNPYSFGVNCNRTSLYFILCVIRAAGVGELTPKYGYTDDYIDDDYPTAGSCPTDSEYLLGIAM
jgi:hypothetical protein